MWIALGSNKSLGFVRPATEILQGPHLLRVQMCLQQKVGTSTGLWWSLAVSLQRRENQVLTVFFVFVAVHKREKKEFCVLTVIVWTSVSCDAGILFRFTICLLLHKSYFSAWTDGLQLALQYCAV
jgi:hypothetical protein